MSAPSSTTAAKARFQPRLGAVVLVTALGMSAGCSSGTESTPLPTNAASSPAASPTPTATTPSPAPSNIAIGKVIGQLKAQQRKGLVRAVGPVIEGWWDAAYLEGPWPRTDFDTAFQGFTKGARVDALKDQELMSNADLGAHLTSVTPIVRKAKLDVLAPERQASGISARFKLRFVADTDEADVQVRVNVRGTLSLRKKNKKWRVFAYDVKKGKR